MSANNSPSAQDVPTQARDRSARSQKESSMMTPIEAKTANMTRLNSSAGASRNA